MIHVRTLVPPVLLGLATLLQGCGGPRPAPTPVPPEVTGGNCPLPVVMPAGQTQPGWVRIENRTPHPLTVYVDRCFWHTRMAHVPAGRARQSRLPGELIAYDDHLLFHAFTDSAHYGSFTTPIQPVPVVEVVLESGRAVDRDSLPRYALDRGEEREAVERTVVTDVEHGYTAVWGLGGGGILTWACSQGAPYLSVATGSNLRREADSIRVRYRLDDGEWSEPEAWEVVRSLTDAVVAPPDRVEELTTRLLASERVQFDVQERQRWRPGSFQFHFAFDLGGVEEELGGLTCVRPLLPPADGR